MSKITVSHGGKNYVNFRPADALAAGVPQNVIDGAIDHNIVVEATAQINAMRHKIFTGDPAQAASYTAKEADARAYKDAGYPGTVSAGDFPYVVAESGTDGTTKKQAADAIIAKADAFKGADAAIEAARRSLSLTVPSVAGEANKLAAANAIVEAIRDAVSVIAP